MSCAKIGSSAVAEAKKVATKSSSMVERTMGCANTNRRPSRAAAQVTCEAGAPAACGRARMTSSAAITIRKETAFTAYTHAMPGPDRKSTRLNSSQGYISYAGFCLKKKTGKHGEGEGNHWRDVTRNLGGADLTQ